MIHRRIEAGVKAIAAALFALLDIAPLPAAEAAVPACMAGPPAGIVVRIGAGAPRHALLRGGVSPRLEVVDADTLQSLWSAAASPPARQLFAALGSPFAGSLLPLDLDGDGVHDRIYAGDLGGQLWRFDLHHGLQAEHWATGGMFADLASGLRGFVAAPDASVPADTSSPPAVLNIALGTVRLGPAPVENRFYVLRDRFAFESWNQDRFDQWRPLRETDLVHLPRLGATIQGPAPNGYFIEVGGYDILSPALTTSGRATLALAEAGAFMGARCSVAAVVSSIDLATANELRVPATADTASSRLTLSMRAGETFALHREESRAACTLGETRITACDVDLAPRRTWWRREDAD
jgi:hypothetical protein